MFEITTRHPDGYGSSTQLENAAELEAYLTGFTDAIAGEIQERVPSVLGANAWGARVVAPFGAPLALITVREI